MLTEEKTRPCRTAALATVCDAWAAGRCSSRCPRLVDELVRGLGMAAPLSVLRGSC